MRLKLCKESDRKICFIHGESWIEYLVHQMRFNLEMQGVRSRINYMVERESYIEEGKKLWKNKKLLILFVTDVLTEEGKVILQQAEKMREMGLQVTLYNISANKAGFQKSYSEVRIPGIYGSVRDDFEEYVHFFDAVCTTFNGVMQYGYRHEWLVSRNCDREPLTIEPNVDIDFFYPKKKKKDGILRILANLKSGTDRKSTEMTLKIMQEIKEKYKKRVEITIFTFDVGQNREPCGKDIFRFENVEQWSLKRKENRRLLQESDIFVDFSVSHTVKVTAMEAMACGCAGIIMGESCPNGLFMNERNCILIDSHKEEICKDALERMLEDDRLREAAAFHAVKDVCVYYPEKPIYNFLKAMFGGNANMISKRRDVSQEKKVQQLNSIFPTVLVRLISNCKELYIYGAGNYARSYANFIIEENIEFTGFVVTAYKDNPCTLFGKRVYLIEDINVEGKDKSYVGFIVAMIPQKGKSVADILKKMGYQNIYIHGISN